MRLTRPILVLPPLIFILLIGLVGGCSAKPTQTVSPIPPPIDSVKIRTNDGNGLIILIMREYAYSLSVEDTENIKTDLKNELGSVYNPNPDMPRVNAVPGLAEGQRIVAFGYAIYSSGQTSVYTGTVGNKASVTESTYRDAEDWFVKQLANPLTSSPTVTEGN